MQSGGVGLIQVEWLTAAQRDAVYEQALRVLERVGMRMQGATALAALRETARTSMPTGVWCGSPPTS